MPVTPTTAWLSRSALIGILVPHQAPGGAAVNIRFYRVR